MPTQVTFHMFMGFRCGIIGLPNVGKSTIFNALTNSHVPMESYPFCTIEPNRGIVPVPDKRLERIAAILGKAKPIPTRIEFVDVAGLVKGASKGEGLGNQFLGHIRNVDALVHVVRCFRSADAVHVPGEVAPVRDIETVITELILADIEVLERAREKIIKLAKAGDKETQARVELIDRMRTWLNQGQTLAGFEFPEGTQGVPDEYGLITVKPVLYLANIEEEGRSDDLKKAAEEYARQNGAAFLWIVGKLEEEISELPETEKRDYLQAMGLQESGLERLVQASYRLLDIITFYTATTDLQAWTIPRGTRAAKAAGKIHTDFERGFIRAEVYRSEDLFDLASEHALKEKGLVRSEGKDYEVKDGDVIHFLFNL